MTPLDTLLRSQLGRPSGLIGSLVVAPILNAANMGLVRTAIELLAPRPRDVTLDVGFGGGSSLFAMAEKTSRGKVMGVDYSRDMVESAERLIEQRRLSARIQVQWGDVAQLPFRAGTFDKAVTINSLYYWPDLDAGLREIKRVLKRSGRLALGFHSPAALRPFTRNWEGFSLYEPEELADRMRDARFDVLEVECREGWPLFDTVVVVARRR